jgi:hypothetical protein
MNELLRMNLDGIQKQATTEDLITLLNAFMTLHPSPEKALSLQETISALEKMDTQKHEFIHKLQAQIESFVRPKFQTQGFLVNFIHDRIRFQRVH